MRRVISALVLSCVAAACLDARAEAAAGLPKVPPPHFGEFAKAELLLRAKVLAATPGPQGMSMPPVHTTRVKLEVQEALRGDAKRGASISARHSARQMQAPRFPVGESCIVAAKRDPRSKAVILTVAVKATEQALASARLAASLPMGWRVEAGKLVSPWSALGGAAWPMGAEAPAGTLACSRTGRPGYVCGKGVKMEVAPVPPPKKIKWTNPDGDGEYRITLTNTTKKPVTVPALLRAGGKALWDESVVVICQGRARPAPRAKGVKAFPKGAVIAPGESVSGVVDALQLDGVEWPRGGYRVEFTFCVGELSGTQSFYYLSRHHDKVREAARARR